jgi:uncharacterized phage-like protein YoqJ
MMAEVLSMVHIPNDPATESLFNAWLRLDARTITEHAARLGSVRDIVQNDGIDLPLADVQAGLLQAQEEVYWFETALPVIARNLLIETAQHLGIEPVDAHTDRPFVIGVTGHRTGKLASYPKPQGGEVNEPDTCHWIRRNLSHILQQGRILMRDRGAIAMSGMAVGVDQLFVEAALNEHVPVWAVVPFVGQASMWGAAAQAYYDRLLQDCWRVTVLHDVAPATEAQAREWLHERNVWMVQRVSRLLAVWDGSDGGTAHTVRRALREPLLPILRLDPQRRTVKWINGVAGPAEEEIAWP